jgi:hypothetical protein
VSAPTMSRECGSACFDICKQKPDRRRGSRLKKSFDEVPLDRRLIILSRSIFGMGTKLSKDGFLAKMKNKTELEYI